MQSETTVPYYETLDYTELETAGAIARPGARTIKLWLGVVFTLGISGWLAASVFSRYAVLLNESLPLALIVCFFIWMRLLKLNRAAQDTALERFAAANKLDYDPSPYYHPIGTLFRLGHDADNGPRVGGTINGYPYTLYWHRYTTGYGRYQTEHQYDVVEIDLPKMVPQIYADHRDHELVEADPIGQLFGKDNLHQLEGAFAGKYKVYFNQIYASAALTLLNPEFMQHLLETGYDCDMELAGKKLFIYSLQNFPSRPARFKHLLEMAEFMVRELERQFDTFTFVPKGADMGTMVVREQAFKTAVEDIL